MSNAATDENTRDAAGIETPVITLDLLSQLNGAKQQLTDLKKKHAKVPDFTTKEGYAAGKKALKELTSIRTGNEKARLAITQPARDFTEQVNALGKHLETEVKKLEQPLKDAKKEVDEAEERKRQERIAKLQERLQKEVTAFLDTAVGLDSNGLADLITQAEAIDTEGYFDITKEAQDERARVIRELTALHAHTLEQERLAAERAEIERERAELQRLRAQQAPATPDFGPDFGESASFPTAPGRPAKPRSLAEEPAPSSFGDMTPWDEALEDLISTGIDVSAAEAVLDAISNGDVRHVIFRGTTGE